MSDFAMVLYSGGLDSTIALGCALKQPYDRVTALRFDYASRMNNQENKHAETTANRLLELMQNEGRASARTLEHILLEDELMGRLARLGFSPQREKRMIESGVSPEAFIPCRNLDFLNHAVNLIYRDVHSYDVYLGVTPHTPGYPCSGARDNDPLLLNNYFYALLACVGVPTDEAALVLPFAGTYKEDIFIKADLELGPRVAQHLLENTYSCHNGKADRHSWGPGCGRCSNCYARIRAYERWRGVSVSHDE